VYPEERVLVGVINRKKDFIAAQTEGWYRIPAKQLRYYTDVHHIAFFLSGKAFKEQSGGIHYHARITGVELAYRYQLLPDEPNHPRANEQYYRIAFNQLAPKIPPILNPSKRNIAFIFTTGDRFIMAQKIADLYSKADYFVERVYHRLKSENTNVIRLWEAQHNQDEFAPGLRVIHQVNVLDQRADAKHITMRLDSGYDDEDAILAAVRAQLSQETGPVIINIPFE
jgi:hypothetical protein